MKEKPDPCESLNKSNA